VLRVGVAGGVLLLVQADGVLGLVEERLIGGASGAGGAGGGAGVAGRAGVVFLDAGDFVGCGLGGRLVGVGEDVTVRGVGLLVGCFSVVRVRVGRQEEDREGLPLDLVGDARDGVGDLVGGRLGAVRGGVVGDLWWEGC
jgi:hypothetical protein